MIEFSIKKKQFTVSVL